MYGSDWMHGMPMMGWGGMVLMTIFWIIVIIGIVLLVSRLSSRKSQSGQSEKTPMEILKERYAKGEINREQFEQMKRDME